MSTHFSPDFIIVGAPKAGTRWIAQCLSEHPAVCVSQPQDTNFFNETASFYHRESPSEYRRGISWYEHCFTHCMPYQKKGEAAVNYLFDEQAPGRIAAHFPRAKIIMILRDPAERLYSHYLHAYKQIVKPFDEIIKTQPDFLAQGFYFWHITRYLSYFSREQLLIMIYDDALENPLLFMRRIYEFIGVNTAFIPPSIDKKINVTAPKVAPSVRLFYWLQRGIFAGPRGKLAVAFLKKIHLAKIVEACAARPIKRMMLFLGRFQKNKRPMTDHARAFLRARYRPEVEALERFLNRDLSAWK